VPRLINILAHKALLAAYGKSANKVERQHMVRAVLDTAESKKWGRWLAKRDYWLWPLLAASAAVALSVTPALGGSL
jgi:MSHA biogenesis protein MshM